ncbi:MAG: phosphatase PAP2 family protein [Verrucomicrobiota bacterium]
MTFRRFIVALMPFLAALPLQADVITEWNEVMRNAFAAQGSGGNPPMNSRIMGMLGGAMFDAVNSVDRNYNSYLGYFDATTAGSSTDVNAAAATAAYGVLSSVFNDLYGAGNAYTQSFTNKYNAQMSLIADGTAKTRGMEVGQAAAGAMTGTRAVDGWNSTPTYEPQPLGTVGRWQPGTTPGAWGAGAGTFLKSWWSDLSPFTMNSQSQFRPTGMNMGTSMDRNVSYVAFNGDYQGWVNSQSYTQQFNQLKTLGGTNSATRTAEQTEIAYFWVDGPGTSSPPGHWNRIAATVSASMGLSVEQNARLFALLNLAAADAGIATWEAKVLYDNWRPMLAINTASTDGNPDTIEDASWTPLIPTPSFGAYTSGHSAFSMAGATILANFFGTDDITFITDTESPFLTPGLTRTFDSFTDAAREAGMSRVYGGIHWADDNIDGAILGEQVGNWVYNNFLGPVAPVPEPSTSLLLGIASIVLLRRRRSLP